MQGGRWFSVRRSYGWTAGRSPRSVTTCGCPPACGPTNLFRSVGPGTYRLAGAQNVGAALDWVRRTLGASWDELYATAATKGVNTTVSCYVMTEGVSRAGKLRKAINVRLEEISFRSGAALSGGAVVVGGAAIALGVILSGGHAAASSNAPRAHVTLRPALVPASVQASASASASPMATPSRSAPALSYYPQPSPAADSRPRATPTSPAPSPTLSTRPVISPTRTYRPKPGPTVPGWPGPPTWP